MFLNDHETATDLLYYTPIAKTVVRLLSEAREAPLTIGVHGDWGAGKSSVLRMTEALLGKEKRVCCVWFNGWTFEGFEDAKTVVIQTIVDELLRARPVSAKLTEAARKVLERVDWLKVAKKGGGLLFSGMTGLPSADQLRSIVGTIKSFAQSSDTISQEDLQGFAEEAGSYLKEAESQSSQLPAHIHEFRKEFKELIEAADIDQLVVIVDDLDRCLPKTAIATLEAIRLFLFVKGTAFVVGADEAMIEYAVRDHFPDMPNTSGPVSYARHYLEKLIQVPFRIPALGLAETKGYITLLQVESAYGADSAVFTKLLAAAQEDMKRPWMSSGLTFNTVSGLLENTVPEQVSTALTISAHLAHALNEGTRGNPRQIKRFLNTMMLRQAIAQERGFGDDIRRPILAKIMLAERFYSGFYEEIASSAALDGNGHAHLIAELEQLLKQDELKTPAEGEKGAERSPVKISSTAEAFIKTDWVKRWVAIEPSLRDTDLRPYIFVTRDQRNTLFASANASHLEVLVEKLAGPEIHARSKAARTEVLRLSDAEAETVFDALRDRILQSDSYNEQPDGVVGLIVLVKEKPALQQRLVQFIKVLPVSKLGSWAPSAWGECLSDATAGEAFRAIVSGWAEQKNNKSLSTSSELVLKLGKN